jgi:hypothetical protein
VEEGGSTTEMLGDGVCHSDQSRRNDAPGESDEEVKGLKSLELKGVKWRVVKRVTE